MGGRLVISRVLGGRLVIYRNNIQFIQRIKCLINNAQGRLTELRLSCEHRALMTEACRVVQATSTACALLCCHHCQCPTPCSIRGPPISSCAAHHLYCIIEKKQMMKWLTVPDECGSHSGEQGTANILHPSIHVTLS
jgi:hypothetical protein